MQFDRGIRDGAHDTANGRFELVGHVIHLALTLRLRLRLGRPCLCLQLAGADHIVLEHLHRASHCADLVAAITERDRRGGVALGQSSHRLRDLLDWL